MDPRLATYAAAHGGVFGGLQAREFGYEPQEVQRLRRNGSWATLRRGIYADNNVLASTRGDASATHTLHIAAALHALSRDVVASHSSAATTWGMALLDGPPDQVHLSWPGPKSTADYPGILLHAATLPPAHREVDRDRQWLTRTSPARTIVDLARTETMKTALVAADSALHLRLTRPAELEEIQRYCWNWPGARNAARVLGLADGRAKSPAETLARLLAIEEGLPAPEPQVLLKDTRGDIGRVDLYWEEQRTVGEVDGRPKYGPSPDDSPEDNALWREKKREDRLRDAGFEVVRMTWYQITRQPKQTVARIRAAFTRGLRRTA